MRANEDRRLPPAATVMGPALAVPLWGAGVPSPVRVARGVAGTVADAEGGPRRLARRPPSLFRCHFSLPFFLSGVRPFEELAHL